MFRAICRGKIFAVYNSFTTSWDFHLASYSLWKARSLTYLHNWTDVSKLNEKVFSWEFRKESRNEKVFSLLCLSLREKNWVTGHNSLGSTKERNSFSFFVVFFGIGSVQNWDKSYFSVARANIVAARDTRMEDIIEGLFCNERGGGGRSNVLLFSSLPKSPSVPYIPIQSFSDAHNQTYM